MLSEMIMLFVLFGIVTLLGIRWGHYLGWKYPEYHQRELQQVILLGVLSVIALVILVAMMASD